MTIPITLGSRVFSQGQLATPVAGARWFMGIPKGWEAPAMRSTDGDPTGRPGGFEQEALHGSRLLVCPGRVWASTESAAWDAYYYLPTLSPLGSNITLSIAEPGGTKNLLVRQYDEPEIQRPQNNQVLFTLFLKALYPYKRATTPVVVTIAAGATATFTHVGTFAAEMEVRTTSTGTVTLTSYGAIQGTGATSVPSGTIFTSGFGFTNPARTVVGPTGLNLYNSLIPTNHWLAVLAGANSIQNTGSANVQVTYYPTWS